MGTLLIDLDGTLVDSLADLAGTLNQLRAELSQAPLARAEVAAMVGDGLTKLVERGLAWPAGGAPPPGKRERLTGRFLEIYGTRLTAETRPYPGVPETLERLRGAGWRLAVCTNKPEAASKAILAALDMECLFETVSGGDSFAKRKPAAEHLLATLARMGAARETAVMVGDSQVDLLSARNAGLPAVLVSYGMSRLPVRDLGADAVIDAFAELPEALAQLADGRPAGPPSQASSGDHWRAG